MKSSFEHEGFLPASFPVNPYLFHEKLHGISCGSSLRRTLCLKEAVSAKAICLQCSDPSVSLMVTPLSVRLSIPRVVPYSRLVGYPVLHTDAASIERSVGTKHSSHVGKDGLSELACVSCDHIHVPAQQNKTQQPTSVSWR